MKRINTLSYFTLIAFLLLTFAACDSTDPDDDGAGEEELITRVVISLNSGAVTATAEDPDGDGVGITAETLNLQAGTTYTGEVRLFNDLASDPVEQNFTAEIEEEDDEHQFFYEVGGGLAGSVAVTITDQDGNGLPVGLDFQIAVDQAASGSGTLRVILSHYDEEPKNGTDRSDETDIDVTFPVNVTQ